MTAITTTTPSTMHLGTALRIIARAGLPTTFSKKRKKAKETSTFDSIKIHLDQHIHAYSQGGFKMSPECVNAITAFIAFKHDLAKLNLENAKSKKGIRKYTKRVTRFSTLLTLIAI